MPLSIANRFRSPRAISYNVIKMDDGFKIEALVPRHTSTADRKKVVQWFQQYRNQVRAKNPFYSARFFNLENGYSLEIKPCRAHRSLDDDGALMKVILERSFENVGR